MTGRLAGKVALITGTASGQGRAAALLFAAEDATVAGTDLNADGAAETMALVRARDGRMDSTHPLDLNDEDGVKAWIDAAAAAHGGIDILYNNAGATRFSPIAETSYADWSYTIRNELNIVFLATRHAWPHLVARGGGCVLLVGSTAGLTGSLTNTRIAHTASKGGVAMTRQLATEGAAHGIRANCISPGMIATPATESDLLAPSSPMRSIARAIPLGRIGTPQEAARCALFLASDEASYVTGANLVVDGGWSAVLPGASEATPKGITVFEYFPGNYVWNLGVVATLNSGGLIDEVDRACRPIRDAAARGEDAGTPDFLRAWTALTDSLVAQAEAAEKAGHAWTAGQLYARATNYLCQAERMQSAKAPGRLATYQRVLALQMKALALKDPRLSRVEIPYQETTLPAYFSPAPATDSGPAPVMIMWNGLDSTKEHMYSSAHWDELAARGISTLMVDCPGSGEALRLQGLTARVDTEAWAAACVDYLLTRDDVDPAAIGLVGWSLGGYYAPRAAAFEKRLALVVAWGANHDWGAVQRRRLQREGERPVPHYWDHVLWVWGYESLDEFIQFAGQVNLDGVAEKITVPFLIAHGAGDRQIPLEYAHRSYDQAVASPKRELRIFTAEEGATEHIGLDHLPHVSTFIADWVSDTFAELSASRCRSPRTDAP